MIQNTPPSQNSVLLLKSILVKRFPNHTFDYLKLQTDELKSIAKTSFDGVIAEVKTLSEKTIPAFDQLVRYVKKTPLIIVVSPLGFQLLQKKRKRILNLSMVILSETKSLDYILQLPRFIDEVGRKRRLKAQNERLQRMVAQKLPDFHSFSAEQRVSRNESARSGLRIQFKNWPRIKQSLGSLGSQELTDSVSRIIHASVRNSDRVLRSNDDEFLVFLSHAESATLNRCRERLLKTLNSLQVSSNQKSIKVPFHVTPLERLSFLTH